MSKKRLDLDQTRSSSLVEILLKDADVSAILGLFSSGSCMESGYQYYTLEASSLY